MTSILERIATHKQQEVNLAKLRKPLDSLAITDLPRRDFIAALKKNNPAIIAEIKRASPSKGIIRADFDVAKIAEIYAANGASALSVLTDEHFFQGHSDYLALAKRHCNLPVLRKDFIIDSYQIHESYALGADCILLIAAMLDDAKLLDYCQLAQELGMAVLVESHTKEELERALQLPTPLMGINNRSLHTFVTDLQCSIELQQYIPKDKIVITESGIHHHNDIKRMQSYGIHTFLVGESLMRAEDIGTALKQLIYGRSK
jgi:indole-3-glycerol phosphate synthase